MYRFVTVNERRYGIKVRGEITQGKQLWHWECPKLDVSGTCKANDKGAIANEIAKALGPKPSRICSAAIIDNARSQIADEIVGLITDEVRQVKIWPQASGTGMFQASFAKGARKDIRNVGNDAQATWLGVWLGEQGWVETRTSGGYPVYTRPH